MHLAHDLRKQQAIGAECCVPRLLLICTLGANVHVALRYFETLNNGLLNGRPYHVQEYLSGSWQTLSRHQKFEDAVRAFETRVEPAEAVFGTRLKPVFASEWTTLFLPEPQFGYQVNANDLVSRWLRMSS